MGLKRAVRKIGEFQKIALPYLFFVTTSHMKTRVYLGNLYLITKIAGNTLNILGVKVTIIKLFQI